VGQPLEVRAVSRHAVDSPDGISRLGGLGKAGYSGEYGDPTGSYKAAKFHFNLLGELTD
jgi:hypothetical protein